VRAAGTSKTPFDAMQMVANLSADRAAPKSESMSKKLAYLEEKVGFMRIANQALWEIVSEKFDITTNEFKTRILEVDFRDGVLDGKETMRILDCPNCHQKVNSKRALCLYCEAPLQLGNGNIF